MVFTVDDIKKDNDRTISFLMKNGEMASKDPAKAQAVFRYVIRKLEGVNGMVNMINNPFPETEDDQEWDDWFDDFNNAI